MPEYWHSSYGFLTKAIIPLSQNLGRMLQIEWQEHDSETWGDYYVYPPMPRADKNPAQETFKLYLNDRGWFMGWNNAQFKNCGVLLSVTTDRPLELDELLFSEMPSKIILLRRTRLEILLKSSTFSESI